MTDITGRRSIPTRYKGVRYRSKLEADWAKTFDVLGVKHQYEKEGHYFGDVFYLPDFWLPASHQYVEVKGVFEPDDCRKIQALLKHIPARQHTGEWCSDIAIIACMPDGAFFGWERGLGVDLPFHQFLALDTRRAARSVELFRCERCRQWWFADPSGTGGTVKPTRRCRSYSRRRTHSTGNATFTARAG